MKVARASEMKEIDTFTIEQMGIPGIVLMENAAIQVIRQIEEDMSGAANKNIVVFAGKGNNGGDALAVARHLHNLGSNVLVVLVGTEDPVKGDARINLDIIKRLGIKLVVAEDMSFSEEIATSLYLADAIVDGLIGTGMKGRVSDLFAGMIHIINQVGRYVISIDIPSGIDGDTGEVFGACVEADKTVALGLPKLGLLVGEGAKYAGRIHVADIGIPQKSIEQKELDINLITKEDINKFIPSRSPYAHKGNFGKVLMIAGSTGLTGAAALTSYAALRTGAGLVTLGVPASLNNIMECKLTEVMTLPLADNGNGCISAKCIDHLDKILENYNVLAVGPGIGCNPDTIEVISWIVENSPIPVIIDADGINSLCRNIDVINRAKTPVILTPHLGEMSRLTGLEVESIIKDKTRVLKDYSGQWACTVVLKDWRTLIGTRDGQIFINTTGNAGMATAGSGDVLTGMIASFTAQGLADVPAAIAGVYIHGLSGDISAVEKGQMGMIAGDILENIPYALKEVIGR